MIAEPLKDKYYRRGVIVINRITGDYADTEDLLDDVKSAVEWLKAELFCKAVFMEHLTEQQQDELYALINVAFHDVVEKGEGDEK